MKSEPAVRTGFCIYCMEHIEYVEGDADSQMLAYAAMTDHDAVCPRNPIRAKLELAMALVREGADTIDALSDQQSMPDDFYVPVLMRMRSFLKGGQDVSDGGGGGDAADGVRDSGT